MSASDDFPRGIVLSGFSGGGSTAGASVTFPASPGIAWTLTDVKIAAYTGTAGSGNFNSFVTANSVIIPVIFLVNLDSVGDFDSDEWSGMITFPVGNAVTVEYGSNNADVQEYLWATAQAT